MLLPDEAAQAVAVAAAKEEAEAAQAAARRLERYGAGAACAMFGRPEASRGSACVEALRRGN